MNSQEIVEANFIDDGYSSGMSYHGFEEECDIDISDLDFEISQGMTTQTRPSSDLTPCVSDISENESSYDREEELNAFLEDVGNLDRPIEDSESFECWGATISAVSDEKTLDFDTKDTFFSYDLAQERLPMDMVSPSTVSKCPNMPVPSYSVYSLAPKRCGGSPTFQETKSFFPTGRHTCKSNKHRTTRQFVPFEEMQRLMSTYGPITSQRTRKPKKCSSHHSSSCAKTESIKRKFYRWFPDFEERFVKSPDTFTYRPKAGHANEISYRMAMRERDQVILVHKRKVARKNEPY